MNNENKTFKLRIGSRKSKLALIQTNLVIEKLKSIYQNGPLEFEIVSVITSGDRILDKPLSQVGSKSLFTKELEDLLIQNDIDFIVHSLKDLPTSLPQGLCISSVLKREDPNDALVLNKKLENLKICKSFSNFEDTLKSLQAACGKDSITIGTSSLRRIAYLKSLNDQINTENIRGNLDTRFSKLDCENSKYTGIILAAAGLKRAGFENRIFQVLDSEKSLHAVGQGALAIECLESNLKMVKLLNSLSDFKSCCECIAERALMLYLKGGCSVPLGVKCFWSPSEVTDEDFFTNSELKLFLRAAVFSLDGKKNVSSTHQVILSQQFKDLQDFFEYLTGINALFLEPVESSNSHQMRTKFLNSARLGVELGKILISLGANEILEEIHKKKGKFVSFS